MNALPITSKRRIVKRHRPAERARGIAADLRECISERTIDRADLRELAGRLETLASDLEEIP